MGGPVIFGLFSMHRLMMTLARALAILGGLVLSTLVVMTCISIVGREINALMAGDWMQSLAPGLANWILATGVIGQVKGDAELVEAGMAFTIFCFLPLCQITASHAAVDIFTSQMPPAVNRVLRMLAELGFAVVLILIAWKLGEGTGAKYANGETSWLLQFPIWWGYALSLVAAIAAAIVAVYMAAMRVAETATGRVLVAQGGEADH